LISPFPLVESDFNETGLSVSVEGTINGITDAILVRFDVEVKHRSRIEPLLMDGGVLRIRRSMDVPCSAKTAVLSVRDASGGNDGEWVSNPTGIPEALKALFPEPMVIGVNGRCG
jgi:putative ATP-dependent endonuclease of OLD family